MVDLSKRYSISILFLITSVVVLGLFFYSMRVAHRIADVHAPSVNAVMKVKLELTKAHLMFEELITGDHSISMEMVLEHSQQAKWYVNALTFGDKDNFSTYIPMHSEELKQELLSMNKSISKLEALMRNRMVYQALSLPGSAMEQQFDAHYEAVLTHADHIEYHLLGLISEERAKQRIFDYSGFGLLIVLLVGVLWFNIVQRNHELKLVQKLDNLATHDELTSLYNRRSFNTILHREWNHAIRSQNSIAIAMCDIDFFKKYNDALGHQAGDRCLQAVSSIMKQTLKRETDSVARYGGEEFVFILPYTDAENTKKILDDLHQILVDKCMTHPKSEVAKHVTLSIGVAACVPKQGQHMEGLIAQADEALYCAKAEGRNKTILASI